MSPFTLLLGLAALSVLLVLLLSFSPRADDILERLFGARKK
ncbi:hypothetical protein [Deinococcus peraridilitoris]|uniref:Uncharacterized protein n=1 Tax=Deinococcus peraridilitoris (strain DSM 19664 / LMG 22246 / CIP 109416 / KR-200) TaxID=937777 RepID=L0A3T9_DEIPD|nr:hypothetical protein [Deinococcus peraridilitoris]AFZ68516.1 hypothetical protein Deipe_3067 [Deinococcus peraridilitoris DSM 19664]